MLRASRSIRRAAHADAGRPLPRIPELAALYEGDFKLKFRQGQTTMIAGPPGSQKSGFALWLCEKFGVPGLYFSADMEEHTAMTRLAALRTGDTTERVSYNMRMVPGSDLAYAEELDQSSLQFCYDPNPSLETVYEEVAAWVELYDEFPPIIVIDNLMDMVLEGGENEYSGMKQMLLELKSLARETSAAIFILHHMSEAMLPKGYGPFDPAPSSAIMGKVSQTVGTVLSVALDPGEGAPVFKLAVVKQRTGPSDKTGRTFHRLKCDPARGRFSPDNYHRHMEATA